MQARIYIEKIYIREPLIRQNSNKIDPENRV